MKIKKNNKKGFTIVELVIVIAVIGILAAILIPTFISLNNKARMANTESFLKNINTQIAMKEADESLDKDNVGSFATMYSAVEYAKKKGFDLEEISPFAGNEIVWDEVNHRFAFVHDEGGDNYSTNYAEARFNIKNAQFMPDSVLSLEEMISQGKKVYVKEKLNYESAVTVTNSFDAGNSRGIPTVTYARPEGEAKSAIVRTFGNMCEFIVNAPSDHVSHFGYAKTTKVVAVNSLNSYHEYGTSSELAITAGKVVIENTGVVFDLKRQDYTYIDEYNVEHTIPAETTNEISNDGGNVMASSVETVVASDSFEINSLSQLNAFRDSTNSGQTFATKTVNLNCDIELLDAWKPIANYSRNESDVGSLAFAGIFNGNNHTIKGLTNVGLEAVDVNTGTNKSTPANSAEVTYGFIASTNGATIKNLKFADVNITNNGFGELLGDSVAACVGFTMGTTTIDKVEVLSGRIEGFDAVGGILGRDKGVSITITNCNNAANVFSYQGAAGIAGRIYKEGATLSIDKCTNSGTVVSNFKGAPKEIPNNYDACYAVGITDIRNNVTGTISNCTNTGAISRRNPTSGSYQSGHLAQITVDINNKLTKTNNTESGSASVIND